MSNVPGFVDRLRLIAKALEEGEPQAKQRAISALRAAADYVEDIKLWPVGHPTPPAGPKEQTK